ncbi:hypothetical protein, partial [Streptomyces sp. NPDC001155]
MPFVALIPNDTGPEAPDLMRAIGLCGLSVPQYGWGEKDLLVRDGGQPVLEHGEGKLLSLQVGDRGP